MRQEEVELREKVGRCVAEALFQVCGGSVVEEQKKQLREHAFSSISFPNKQPSSAGGKPHDIEVRVALALFHRLKRAAESGNSVEIVSDLGLSRDIPSPRRLAEILCLPLEEACRSEGLSPDVRCQPSGVICIVTYGRSQLLRQAGKLPCPYCVKWCQGEKGLWWHQQQNHHIEYSQAAAVAAASMGHLALIPYDPNPLLPSISPVNAPPVSTPPPGSKEDPLECIKSGDLAGLRRAVQNDYTQATKMDHRGAFPLMWAAGGGHLEIVQYLIEDCGCDPSQPQQGKRSFSGRTALHWAARNGHLPVVKYLACEREVDVEAATIDGTTAFCWACWQGHQNIMEFLCDQGCNMHCTNSFGCNPVLWCAQGKGDVSTMQWLQARKCDLTMVNHNGHGVAHKAAQRGQREICRWFFENWVVSSCAGTALRLVGPDTEGYCPSDLAGMEGCEDLARWLALKEMDLIRNLKVSSSTTTWLHDKKSGISMRISEKEQYTWERFGGIRRMRSKLRDTTNEA